MIKHLSLLITLLLIGACTPLGKGSDLGAKAPVLTWDNQSFDFGDVGVGATAQAPFTLKNTGSIRAISCGPVELSDNTNFSIASNTCSDEIMESGAECIVQIVSQPQSPGQKDLVVSRACADDVVIQSGSMQIVVNAIQPTLNFSPLTNDFGDLYVGTDTAPQAFTLSNSGTADATGCSVAALSNSTDFSITADTCSTADLAISASCLVSVKANPTTIGLKTTTLTRTCTFGGVASTTSQAIQVYSRSAVLAWSDLTHDFGSVTIGNNSTSKNFTLSNTGDMAASSCSAPTISDTTNFSITVDNCNTSDVAVSGSCDVTVLGHPTTLGAKTATLSRTCTLGGTVSTTANQITVTGTGTVSLAWSPLTHDFGSTDLSVPTSAQTFTLTNSGALTATGCNAPTISDTTNFSITVDNCDTNDVSANNGTCTVNVRGNPTTVGAKTATLSRTCTQGGTVTTTANQITVTGTSPSLAWSPLTHDFGNVNVGSNGSTRVFTLSNSGTAPATSCSTPILSDTINFSEYSSSCGTQDLANGSSCSFVIRARPQSLGLKTATLSRTCMVGGTVTTTSDQITVTGVIAPVLAWSPLTHSFGNINTGGDSLSRTFTLTNSGGAAATSCSTPTISDTTNFTILSDTCSTSDLAVSGTCNISVQANPTTAGLKSTTVSRTCTVGGTATTTSNQITTTGLATAFVGQWQTPSSGSITMNQARERHAQVVLQNGKVLVAGGSGGSSNLSSAELYDPATGVWSYTGSMSTERGWYHTLTVLSNGKALVVGGSNSGGTLNTAELYDPATGTWSYAGTMSSARSGHSATVLPNGKVLVAGGSTGFGVIAAVEIYDPDTNSWSPTGSMGIVRQYHTASLLPNGKVLVTGGTAATSVGSPYSSAEIYDPGAGTWSATGSMAMARHWHAAAVLLNGKVLVVGGFSGSYSAIISAEIYDPGAGTWSSAGNMSAARFLHSISLLANGKVLAAGGSSVSGADIYDPVAGSWAATGGMPATRSGHMASVLPNGIVMVVGGTVSSAAAASWIWYTY